MDFFYNTHNFSNKPNIFINEYKIKVDIQGRVKCVDGVKDSITFLELGITDNFKCTILDWYHFWIVIISNISNFTNISNNNSNRYNLNK